VFHPPTQETAALAVGECVHACYTISAINLSCFGGFRSPADDPPKPPPSQSTLQQAKEGRRRWVWFRGPRACPWGSIARAAMVTRRNWIFWTTRFTARIVLAPLFRLEIRGTEHLPQRGAFVLLPKHQRWEDIPLISLAAPRPLYYVARDDLFDRPVKNWFMRSLGGIPLNRRRPLETRESLRALEGYLRKGEGVVVFPEGTYYRNEMGPGRVGMVRFVLSRFSLPFIPVGIRYSKRMVRTLVRITFGEARYPDPGISPTLFLSSSMEEIERLSGIR
jgi:1-acyl-sn-glycerol-3-phosphate acyltransferase